MSMMIVGVMGPGEGATEEEMRLAYDLGKEIASQGWVLLTGGRNVGVMDAASRGARAGHGIVVGILPGTDVEGMSGAVDIPVITGMHEARNSINVLSGRVLFFVGMSAGTASELALAVKSRRPAILMCQPEEVFRFFAAMSFTRLGTAADAVSAIELAKGMLAADPNPPARES